jgi:hypothetical protein
MRSAIVLIAIVVSALSAGCGGDFQGEVCSSGPCSSGPHQWRARELVRDVASATFPPHNSARDHLYQISCRITDAGARAVLQMAMRWDGLGVTARRLGAMPD